MLFLSYVLLTLHMFVGLFLIGLILLQRGRGGGLAGAFGGMGGQSAFGTKAGDVFTRITIVVATIWIVLACICILVVNNAKGGRFKPGAAGTAVVKAPAADKDAKQDQDAMPADEKPKVDKVDEEKKDDAAEANKDGDTEAKSKAAESDKSAPEKGKTDEKPASADTSAGKKPD